MLTRFPSLAKGWIKAYSPWESEGMPWASVKKRLNECGVAIVTTAGVHHRDQPPFDMKDPFGDPSFRDILASWPVDDLTITHDYYDHSDADKDINVVFPVERLKELEGEGVIGYLSSTHYGFMGHIDGPHVRTLVEKTAPEIARRLKEKEADLVLLTPG
jgi:D-proline reductase (dithiol) PrdB